MGNLSVYFFLIITYLGMSKTFSLGEEGPDYLKKFEEISQGLDLDSFSLILLESYKTGLFVHSYYQKLLFISLNAPPEIVYRRVNKIMMEKTKKFEGLSIFRRRPKTLTQSYLPMPPGTIILGNLQFGKWIKIGKKKVWKFHEKYKHMPEVFGWGDFRPDYNFYKQTIIHLARGRPFYGTNNEFGKTGIITIKNMSYYKYANDFEDIGFKQFLHELLRSFLVIHKKSKV